MLPRKPLETRETSSLCGSRANVTTPAVALFLSEDALPPMALTSLRSDRAARRFCDRLVELGAVRELTGRDTFRLYGV
ncbi:MAG: DUF1403 family protein [Pseudomonadota bacterium]